MYLIDLVLSKNIGTIYLRELADPPKIKLEPVNVLLLLFILIFWHKCKITDPFIARVKNWVVMNSERALFSSRIHIYVACVRYRAKRTINRCELMLYKNWFVSCSFRCHKNGSK